MFMCNLHKPTHYVNAVSWTEASGSRMNDPPSIPQAVDIESFYVKPLSRVVLQDGDRVVAAFE
jgi:hypothetical protein